VARPTAHQLKALRAPDRPDRVPGRDRGLHLVTHLAENTGNHGVVLSLRSSLDEPTKAASVTRVSRATKSDKPICREICRVGRHSTQSVRSEAQRDIFRSCR
jgi:hypothetical protein